MRKFAAVTCLVLGLAAVPGVASAAPIGLNGCGAAGVCDIFADYTGTGASALGELEGNPGDYLLGYTLLLNQAADLSDGFQKSDVAHILVIHDRLFELFSNTLSNTRFDAILAAASADAPLIDGLSIGQLAGCPPVDGGVPHIGGVGLCATGDLVSVLVDWGVAGGDAGQDLLTIHTAYLPGEKDPPPPPPDPQPVPEPGTLSLLVLGGSAALAARRRRRTAKNA